MNKAQVNGAMQRQVIHLNISHFMARVEEIADSRLRGRPFVISHPGAHRAIAVDVSETGYREGLRRGMSLEAVRRISRDAMIVPPRYDKYERAQSAVYERAARFSPLVEQRSWGHVFVDITGTRALFGRPVDIAARLKQELAGATGLNPTTGLAGSKLVSKVATRVVKPDGFVVLRPGDEQGFLAPQSVWLLPGIGVKLGERMRLLGLGTVGDLAALSDEDILAAFGKRGLLLRAYARGMDADPVGAGPSGMEEIKRERLFASDTADPAVIESAFFALVEDAGFSLRRDNVAARRISIALFYTDAGRELMHARLRDPVSGDRDLFAAVRGMLHRHALRRVRIRKIGISVSLLEREPGQPDLFVPPERLREESLQRAVDRIRNRFGRDAIRIGRGMGMAGAAG